MNGRNNANNVGERLKIQEKALSNLADSLKNHEREEMKQIHDLRMDVKALKLFLARTIPEFKKQFPEIQKKLR